MITQSPDLFWELTLLLVMALPTPLPFFLFSSYIKSLHVVKWPQLWLTLKVVIFSPFQTVDDPSLFSSKDFNQWSHYYRSSASQTWFSFLSLAGTKFAFNKNLSKQQVMEVNGDCSVGKNKPLLRNPPAVLQSSPEFLGHVHSSFRENSILLHSGCLWENKPVNPIVTFQKCCWDHRKHCLLNSFAQRLPFFILHRGLQHQILCVCLCKASAYSQAPNSCVQGDRGLIFSNTKYQWKCWGSRDFSLNISQHPNRYHFFSPVVYHSSLCTRKLW